MLDIDACVRREKEKQRHKEYRELTKARHACSTCGAPDARLRKNGVGATCRRCSAVRNKANSNSRHLRRRLTIHAPCDHAKICKHCEIEKPAQSFTVSPRLVTGRRHICNECNLAARDPAKVAEWRKTSRQRENEKRRAISAATKPERDGRREAKKRLQESTKQERIEAGKQKSRDTRKQKQFEASKLKPWLSPELKTLADKRRVRRMHDPLFALRERLNLQGRKRRALRNLEYGIRSTLLGKHKLVKFERRLGYTVEQLKDRFEELFTEGMSWEAFGRGEIHIDHINPVANYDLDDPAQVKLCWALSNLQPLWAADNMRKAAK